MGGTLGKLMLNTGSVAASGDCNVSLGNVGQFERLAYLEVGPARVAGTQL